MEDSVESSCQCLQSCLFPFVRRLLALALVTTDIVNSNCAFGIASEPAMTPKGVVQVHSSLCAAAQCSSGRHRCSARRPGSQAESCCISGKALPGEQPCPHHSIPASARVIACQPQKQTLLPLRSSTPMCLTLYMTIQASPGQVGGLLQSSLSQDLQQRLQQYCQSAGVSIV